MKKLRGCLAILLLASMCLMDTSVKASQSEVDRLHDESENASHAVDDLNNQVQQVQNTVNELEGQANTLSGQINSLNTQITTVAGEISDTEENIALVQADIDVLNEQLETTQQDLDSQREAMKTRIQYMYESSSTNTLVNYLESGSMSGFLQRLEYMSEIVSYDQMAIKKFEETQQALEETKSQIEEKNTELTAYQGTLESKKSELGTLVNSTAAALDTTNGQIADSQAALTQLKQQLEEAKAYEQRIQQQYQAAQAALAEKLAGEHGGYSGGYSTTDEETLLLAALIQAEADNQGTSGRLAVGSVVMNRVASPKFPNSVSGVIYASGQFAPVTSGRVALILAQGPNSGCQKAAADAIAGNINTDALFFCTYSYAQNLHNTQVAAAAEAGAPTDGVGFLDRTSGTVINAHYFYNYN